MNNGYTSIDFNGEKLGIKFGMPANQAFFIELKENPSKLIMDGAALTLIGAARLLYYGYLNNCEVKDVLPVYTKGDFVEWMEEVDIDPERQHVYRELYQCYIESKYTKAWDERLQKLLDAEEEKKKMMNPIGNTSNLSATENLD